ncbi:MAG: hypothetical protein ABFD14_03870 [Anaerolineaceae bacterium]
MTIWERVAASLSSLQIPVSEGINLQATSANPPTEKPAAFAVYSLISSPPEQFADNAETMRSYRVQVSYYSRSGLVGMPDIKTLMTTAGFMPGPITEIPYDPSDGYFGLALEYVFVESEV